MNPAEIRLLALDLALRAYEASDDTLNVIDAAIVVSEAHVFERYIVDGAVDDDGVEL